MSVFKKIKDWNDGYIEKTEHLRKSETDSILRLKAHYLGGYQEIKDLQGILNVKKDTIEFVQYLKPKFSIDREDISQLAFEGRDEVSKRVTVTRLLAIGLFAFAFKKKSKDKEAYLVVKLNNENEVIFRIDGKSPMELRAQLGNFLQR